MPFGPVFAPSIGLSLLKAGLAQHGVSARIQHFSIRFAEAIGQAFYSGIADGDNPPLTHLVGEWIFVNSLFDTSASDKTRYVEEILTGCSPAMIARITRARARVDAFLDECLDSLLRDRPKMVGFTSIFQQHVASLALARRLKQTSPMTFVVMGGANCEGVMGAETLRSFPFVDAVVSGEADLVFPELVLRVLRSEPVSGMPGVRTRDRIDEEFATGRFSDGPMVREMDSLPFPDYTDYFEQFKASRYDREWQPSVFFESSRGCWWGQRMHCTFCGLNGSTMTFRSKSAGRALDELTELVGRHPDCKVEVVDNILDMRYFRDFLPELAARSLNVSLFYETKSNLKKEQVRLLRAAGIRQIQPGIESLSDSVLKLMRKGVTGLQNIQLLKWCKELGIEPSWNFLWGFPGESPEEYERLARVVPLLTHLRAPVSHDDIRLDRFSPNFFDAEKLGFTDVAPLPAYKHVYSLSDAAVANLACYFTFRYREPRDVERYVRPLARELDKWKRLKDGSDLFAVDAGEHLVIVDLRPVSRAPLTLLTGLERLLYLECDAACELGQLTTVAAAADGSTASREAIEQRLAPLVERGLLLRDGSRYLALAIPLREYAPPRATIRQFARILKKFGSPTENGWIVRMPEVGTGSNSARRARRGSPARTRGVRPSRIRRLVRSQFSVDAWGRLVIQASGASDAQRREGLFNGEKDEEQRAQNERGEKKEIASPVKVDRGRSSTPAPAGLSQVAHQKKIR
jgi:ribosomal peptide maturation radical SAM protein 1